MIDRKLELKKWQINTLKGKTIEEKIQEINERIFIIEMKDHLDNEDFNIIKILQEIKKEMENKKK